MLTPLENLINILKSNMKNKKRFYFKKSSFYYSEFLTGLKKLILRIMRSISRFCRRQVLRSLKFYQRFLSPDQGIFNPSGLKRVCRFYPSCSEYWYRVIEKYGILRGSWKGLKRISKCHPWHPGGIDLA